MILDISDNIGLVLTISILFSILLGFILHNTLRCFYETPPFIVIRKENEFEIRDYPAIAIVETASDSLSFIRLYCFLKSYNIKRQLIAMRNPVIFLFKDSQEKMAFFIHM